MANYCCAVRTNYFRVKDADKFRKFMGRAMACEDSISVWEKDSGDGVKLYGFGCYSPILGVGPPDNSDNITDSEMGDLMDGECDYEAFIEGLSEIVTDDDAIIIFESGNEKLRYVTGLAEIITSKETRSEDIETVAVKIASEMLGNPSWKTDMWY